MRNQKYVFLQALLIAILLFLFGMLIGALVENTRANALDFLYIESQIDMTDLRLGTEILGIIPFDCNVAIQENINFADKIYSEALNLEKFDSVSKISDKLKIAHKRYDVLRTLLWINSIKIKEKCIGDYSTVVYFYQYLEPSTQKRSEQRVISRILADLKNRRQDEIILIPIAGDMEISSLKVLMRTYNITELPAVLIDEKTKLLTLDEIKDIENYLR